MSLTHQRVRPTSLSDTRDTDVNLAGWVLTNSAGDLTKWAQEMATMRVDSEDWKTMALMVVAPIIGELLFRGYVFRVMQRAWSPKNAIAASALLFAIVHPGFSFRRCFRPRDGRALLAVGKSFGPGCSFMRATMPPFLR